MSVLSPAYTLADQARMTRAKNYFAWQARLVKPELGQRVVEFGCGIGNFTAALLDREAVIAVDVERACIERLRERFPDQPNLHAFPFDIDGGTYCDLGRFQPDSCVCMNVLEHVEHDGEAIRGMASILRSGGVIVLLVPAFPSLYGPIDRNLGHFRRYRRAEMAEAAARAGMRIKKAHYVNAIGFFGWWINAHVLKREAQSPGQIDFFDRRVVPIASRVEAMAPPPFGQSLLAVLEKP